MFFHFFLFFSSFDFFLANEYGEELDTGAIIDAFNKVRKDAYPPPSHMNQLQWDDGLAKAAQAAADACTFGEQLGQQAEKIFRTIAAPDGRRYMGYRLTVAGARFLTVMDTIKGWGAEKENYDYCRNEGRLNFRNVNGYVEAVWAHTTHVGCAQARCPKATRANGEPLFEGRAGEIVVCTYWPYHEWYAGNVAYRPYQTKMDPCQRKGRGQLAKVDPEAIVKMHNDLRTSAVPTPVNMKQLQWNEDLANLAQAVASSCEYKIDIPDHYQKLTAPDGLRYGRSIHQLLFAGAPTYNMSMVMKKVEGEKKNYDFCKNAPRSEDAPVPSTYKLMVWAETTHVGCAQARCPYITQKGRGIWDYRGGDMLVCSYWPGGNDRYRPYKTSAGAC